MSIKKTAVIAGFVGAIFVSANLLAAKAYTPLVRIPGLPPEGEINLSQYILGLYHFLLSVVGILAVLMLIIGGMKYITAAGNATVATDAKDTIWNAILGLLLALLSWVIISTINPDVLYIKSPTAGFTELNTRNLASCYESFTAPDCRCKDGTDVESSSGNISTCQIDCKEADRCDLSQPFYCLDMTSGEATNEGTSRTDKEDNTAKIMCKCADKEWIPKTGATCQATCMSEDHCGWDFLVVMVNTDGNERKTDPDQENHYYVLDTGDSGESELWNFFLTNDGTWDGFDIFDYIHDTRVSSYTPIMANPPTFECAILVTARRTTDIPVIIGDDVALTGDYRNIFWVLPGTKKSIIKAGGLSMERDLCGAYAQCCYTDIGGLDPACHVNIELNSGCDLSYYGGDDENGDNCVLSTDSGGNLIGAFNQAGHLFRTNYTDSKNGIQNRCGSENDKHCDFAESPTTYRPAHDLYCDPRSGKWMLQ